MQNGRPTTQYFFLLTAHCLLPTGTPTCDERESIIAWTRRIEVPRCLGLRWSRDPKVRRLGRSPGAAAA